MLEAIEKMTSIKSPQFLSEIKLHCVTPHSIEYPFTPTEYNCMYGYPTWSGIALSRYILDNPTKFHGKNIADVGCGSGVASIAAAFCGADVTSIDRDVASLYFTEQNCILNNVQTTAVWGSFKDIKTEYVMFSSLFYDHSNADNINKVLSQRKTIIGSLKRDLPHWITAKMNRIRVDTTKELYVFTNFDLGE